MFTKTQAKIMEIFVSKIDDKFSIKEIAEALGKPYPLIHRSIKGLIEEAFVTKDKKGFLSINYKLNYNDLAYIESLRAKKWIKKDKIFALLTKDLLDKINLDFFVLLIFGSAVENKNPRDIDILLIIENKSIINEVEKLTENISSNFTKKIHINVIIIQSVYEMLVKRDSINVINETLNNHIVLFGAENYYRILKNAR